MARISLSAALAAAGLLAAAPAMAEEFDWSGAYIGAQVGYASGESGTTLPGFPDFSDNDPEGWLGGLYAGYNWSSSGAVVFGLEADFAALDVRDDGFLNTGITITGATIETDAEWTGAIRGRVGYAFGRLLPYIAGGLALADITTTFQDASGGDPGPGSATYAGWTVGAGLDFAFAPNFIGRVEYRYSDYGDEDFDLAGIAATVTDLTTHDVRLGLAYKF